MNKLYPLLMAVFSAGLIACDGDAASHGGASSLSETVVYDPLIDADIDIKIPVTRNRQAAAVLNDPPVVGEYFQITDRWLQTELYSNGDSDFLAHAEIDENDFSAQWSTERISDEWFRIKNRETGEYIHIEPADGIVRVGPVSAAFWSNHWRFNTIGDYVSIENRWFNTDRLHVENNDGQVSHASVGDNLWSAQWTLIPAGNADGNPGEIGQWSEVIDWPLIAIHAALTSDGKVMTYGTDENGEQGAQFFYDVWNPALGTAPDAHATLPNTTSTDMFCSAQMLIPGSDDMLITGGDSRGLNTGILNRGVADANIFNSASSTLNPTASMSAARWYPTLTALPNGEILVQGGIDLNGAPARTPEIYNAQTSSWRALDGATNDVGWWYPRSWVAPDGSIFGISEDQLYRLDTRGAGSYERIGDVTGTNYHITSSAVMFRPGRILQLGGGTNAATSGNADASAQVTEYNINSGEPVVTERPDMAFARHWGNATVLPDGKVLVTGGSEAANFLIGVATAAEIYDPDTQQWLTAASAVEDRLYHSTAILLPDASVLVAGGGAPAARDASGQATPGNVNAEIYYPPYFFDENNNRRELAAIVDAPDEIALGETFLVTPASAVDVSQVNLVRVGSVTHSFNMDQRFMSLDFTVTGGNTLSVAAPTDPYVAPPGYYMLFVVDQDGVPSTAQMISITNDGEQWFQLSDRWTSKELHMAGDLGVVEYGEAPATQLSSHWTEEELGYGDWVRLKNRVTGEYIHVEQNNGTLSAGDIGAGAWSSHWGKTAVGPYTVYNNHWQESDIIHVESQAATAEHSAVSYRFSSAQWLKVPVQ